MIVLIIKKIPNRKWLPGTLVDFAPEYARQLVKDKYAVRGFETLEQYKESKSKLKNKDKE